jgi:TolB-like protein/DNA-binding winged helix-turn-helix (wHTH) protein/Tfp pilus assembly protein PilF
VKLKLRPQACQVLLVLLERAGEGVRREELQQRVWPSNTFVDFEHGLNTAIKELRAVLSDSASEPRYIETLPKLGYRVIAPVSVERAAAATRAVVPELQATEVLSNLPVVTAPAAVIKPRRGGRLAAVLAVCAALAIGSIAFVRWPRSQPLAHKVPAKGRMMVAVLPFENLMGEEGQDYFSDGLTEEMIAQLGQLDPQQFGVIARTSVMHYKHTSENIEQIGRELGVQYVLEGSVRHDSEKIRINAQLIEAGSQRHVWGQEYDRKLTNLLGLQTEIAYEISNEIQLTLGGSKQKAIVSDASLSPQAYQAYDLYLKGLYFWNKRTLPGFQQAIGYFEQAIAKDPSYAPAYAGLANTYTLLTSYSLAPTTQYMPKARAAALQALKLDDKLPEAHIALALIVENYDWDWDTAEKEYRRAIELNPNYATAHHWYAELLTWRGRFDEALRESEYARQLDPLSLIIATDHAAILYYSRQYDQAIEQFRAVLDMDPNFPRAYQVINAYVEEGRYTEALAAFEEWHRLTGKSPWEPAQLAYIYGRAGQKKKALQELGKLELLSRNQPIDPAVFVSADLAVGEKKEALARLEKAYSQHSNVMTTLKVEPAYDSLRDDPRFEELMRRVGLAQ